MNKREAKRLACAESVCVLEDVLRGGWPYGTLWFHRMDQQDRDRFIDAMAELVCELERRSGGNATISALNRDNDPYSGIKEAESDE